MQVENADVVCLEWIVEGSIVRHGLIESQQGQKRHECRCASDYFISRLHGHVNIAKALN
jgi:hypothetical protein